MPNERLELLTIIKHKEMKELINILCPKIKPYSEWTREDKKVAVLYALIVVCFILVGFIESLPE